MNQDWLTKAVLHIKFMAAPRVSLFPIETYKLIKQGTPVNYNNTIQSFVFKWLKNGFERAFFE